MNAITENVLLLSLSLSLLIPAASGIAICIGGDGHTAIVTTSENHCCSADNDHHSADRNSDHAGHLEHASTCIDIALSGEIKSPRQHNNSPKISLSTFAILDLDILTHTKRCGTTHSVSAPSGVMAILTQLRNIIIIS